MVLKTACFAGWVAAELRDGAAVWAFPSSVEFIDQKIALPIKTAKL
jgi:hypothetical protein